MSNQSQDGNAADRIISIPDAKQFYLYYPLDALRYKQTIIQSIRERYDAIAPELFGDESVIRDELFEILAIETRANYLQAIETLFEFIFALEPREGTILDEHVWYRLSTSNWQANYGKIEKIAESEEMPLLEEKWTVDSGQKISGGHYLFYFSSRNQQDASMIDDSVMHIKRALILMAKDFAERHEYNAMKHSLRLVTWHKQLEITTGKGSEKREHVVDLSNSRTFMFRLKKDPSLYMKTIPIDTERDQNMSVLAWRLLSNIICTRKLQYDQSGFEKVYFFSRELIEECSKRSEGCNYSLSFKITPVDLKSK